MPRVQLDRFPGGKLPAQPARKQLRFASFTTSALPAPPDTQDWLGQVPDWPMYGNDNLGDCTAAEVGHQIEQFTQYGQGRCVEISINDVLDLYQATSGYVPGRPETDQGAYVQDVLNYWRKNGVAGHRIVAFASLDVGNLTQVRQAINIFGSVNIGFNFPRSAMDQFNRDQPWDVVPGSPLDGGHCVMVGKYDPTYLHTVTWGAVQPMTYAFWRRYVDEAYVVITQEWVNSVTKRTPQGFDLAALARAFAEVTGEPAPVPDTPPAPDPSTDEKAAGDWFYSRNREWAHKRHSGCNARAAKDFVAWAKSTGRE